ncbi:olfactory receptor 6C3-like [Protobothrops mucrosquamatus]|uniref:olfactory receptor 6C3-like n=1 Tax=Protobothrops mucrosquamatus TaxID=103944 RepID=UPI000775B2FB|nr:olfactory receptor 6C3-like [Protobothrops mucrosquamatus]
MKNNETRISEFILVGLTDVRKLQLLFFAILFFSYLLTITGNFMIILLANVDHRLHTPMYFFLWNFSIMEIGFTTVIIPQTLSHLLMGNKNISYVGCIVQCFLYFYLGTTEVFFFVVMSYDRYLAICNPLRYPSIMHKSLCTLLVFCCWIGSFLIHIGPFVVFLQFPMCNSNILDHFFCDSAPLMHLLCGDTRLLEFFVSLIAIVLLFGTLFISVVSYINIIKTILNIPTATGRKKAFSTCAAHFMVVSIAYGSSLFLYISPTQTSKMEFAKRLAILNTIVSPLLTPFIYSLRNQQVREASKDLWKQIAIIIKGSRKT